MLVLLYFVIAGILLGIDIYLEWKAYNHGVCPFCGSKYRLRLVGHKYRFYQCENRDNEVFVTYKLVDKVEEKL